MPSLAVLRTYRRAVEPLPPGDGLGPGLRYYTEDLASPYGLASYAHLMNRATLTYADLSEQALAELVSDEPIDAIALANLVPEVDPRRAIANQLSSRFPTEPLTFGVSDHGTAAPFTAAA